MAVTFLYFRVPIATLLLVLLPLGTMTFSGLRTVRACIPNPPSGVTMVAAELLCEKSELVRSAEPGS